MELCGTPEAIFRISLILALITIIILVGLYVLTDICLPPNICEAVAKIKWTATLKEY